MNNQEIRTLTLQFKNEISTWEIPLFRGCVIHSMEQANILFHNHTQEDGLRYAYPLIQYKRIGGKAAIVCIGEGTEAIGNFFQAGNFTFNLGERTLDMDIEHIGAKKTLIQVWDADFHYTLRKWLPLSSENYHTYKELDGIVEQSVFLQNILVGNILSFCKGVGITIEKEIKCSITNLLGTKPYTHKGVKMMGFDIEFKSNISLPDFIGLGKGVSMGFGTVTKKKK